MIKILLPTMAAFRDDVETMFSLLEKKVNPAKYQIGLEVIGKHKHFYGQESTEALEKIKKNITSVAKGSYIVVHGFSGLPVYTEGVADMRTDVGRELLETYLRLGESIGAAYVHVHTAAGYRGTEKSVSEKRAEAEKVKQNMFLAVRNTDSKIPVGIENLPTPSTGDLILEPDKIFRDCVETLEECCKVVKDTEFKITLDTCHYAAGKAGDINLKNAITEIDTHTDMFSNRYLRHLHISDVSGVWIPNQELWKEGVIPGEGRIEKVAFKEFFDYVKHNFPDIGICVEVANTNFKNPAETEESLDRVLYWLEGVLKF